MAGATPSPPDGTVTVVPSPQLMVYEPSALTATAHEEPLVPFVPSVPSVPVVPFVPFVPSAPGAPGWPRSPEQAVADTHSAAASSSIRNFIWRLLWGA